MKLFVDEPGSGEVRALLEDAFLVFTSEVAYPEARAALSWRRHDRSLPPRQLTIAKRNLDEKWADLVAIPATPAVRREAGELAERYHLRGFDSIHLASFAEMLRNLQGRDDVEFSSFDDHLNRAARRVARSIG